MRARERERQETGGGGGGLWSMLFTRKNPFAAKRQVIAVFVVLSVLSVATERKYKPVKGSHALHS